MASPSGPRGRRPGRTADARRGQDGEARRGKPRRRRGGGGLRRGNPSPGSAASRCCGHASRTHCPAGAETRPAQRAAAGGIAHARGSKAPAGRAGALAPDRVRVAPADLGLRQAGRDGQADPVPHGRQASDVQAPRPPRGRPGRDRQRIRRARSGSRTGQRAGRASARGPPAGETACQGVAGIHT